MAAIKTIVMCMYLPYLPTVYCLKTLNKNDNNNNRK